MKDVDRLTHKQVEQCGVRWATQELFPMWQKPGTPVIDTHHFRQSEMVQRLLGDFLVTLANGEVLSFEVKAERRHTGNLFLESWSNLTNIAGYRRDGWLFTLQADVYVNIFLDQEVAYAMRMADLRRWALEEGNAYSYPERPVHIYLNGGQKNNTLGFVVPVTKMLAPVKIRKYNRVNGVWSEETGLGGLPAKCAG